MDGRVIDDKDQLKRLDERSASYGRQFWQVPIAYAAGGIIAAASAAEKEIFPFVLFANGVVGWFVVWHLTGLYWFARHTYDAIKSAEERAQIPTREQSGWRPHHMWALIGLAIATAFAFTLLGVIGLWLRRRG
jgi:hypothetical protein